MAIPILWVLPRVLSFNWRETGKVQSPLRLVGVARSLLSRHTTRTQRNVGSGAPAPSHDLVDAYGGDDDETAADPRPEEDEGPGGGRVVCVRSVLPHRQQTNQRDG